MSTNSHPEFDAEASAVSVASSLLVRLRQQDSQSWQELFKLYSPIVRGWLHQAGLQGDDVDDVVQEVFRSVWSKISNFRRTGTGSTFRGWLWVITQNKLRDLYRSRHRAFRSEGGTDARIRLNLLAQDTEDSTQCPAAGATENQELIQRAIDLVKAEVKPQTWEAFWLTTIDGLTAIETAERLNIKIGSVYTARCRVLTRLRNVLGENAELYFRQA